MFGTERANYPTDSTDEQWQILHKRSRRWNSATFFDPSKRIDPTYSGEPETVAERPSRLIVGQIDHI